LGGSNGDYRYIRTGIPLSLILSSIIYGSLEDPLIFQFPSTLKVMDR
jgi:hypothetical protein